MQSKRNSHPLLVEIPNRIDTLEDSLEICKYFIIDPTILCIDNYSYKLKNHVHTNTCTQMFVAVLFRTAKNWKQPTCLSTGKEINKLVALYGGMSIQQ